MGKPYEGELEALSRTYGWALDIDLNGLAAAVRGHLGAPLIVVGSGGSLTAAHFACYLHTLFTSRLARAMTPYELSSSPVYLGDLGVLLLTAGGGNPDILACFQSCLSRSPRRLSVICTRNESPLADLAKGAGGVTFHEFGLPTVKDGFLATNSLLATCVLLARAYHGHHAGRSPLPPSFGDLAHPGQDDPSFRSSVAETCRPLWGRSTFVVLHGLVGQSGAVDLESKFTEAALGQVQLADYRNFAHGRHHWLARHGGASGVISLASPEDQGVAKKTLGLLPRDVPVAHFDLADGVAGSLQGVALSLFIAGAAGLALGTDPGRPSVPPFGRKLYHLNGGYGGTRKPKIPDSEAAAVARKAGATLATLTAQGRLPFWREAYARFRGGLEEIAFSAVVFDYDGTLCDAAERYEGPGAEVTSELLKLLQAGVLIGIATGRGKSVRKDLRARIEDPSLQARVLIGYHNGAEIGALWDDSQPPTSAQIDESLDEIRSILLANGRLATLVKIKPGLQQITLEFTNCSDSEEVWETVQNALARSQFPGVSALRSSHSVDILAPGVSKRHVVAALRQMLGPDSAYPPILTIGDRGRWPGNDFALLQEPHSLSVDEVSADPSTCWNLSSPENRCASALREYFRAMRLGDGLVSLRF